MVKPKRTFLLLLIGAAIIVTVIWSTRSVNKPTFLAAEQTVKYGFIGYLLNSKFEIKVIHYCNTDDIFVNNSLLEA